MSWERYINTEILTSSSLLELQQIRSDLLREQAKQQQKFIAHRDWISQEFNTVFQWYRQHYQLIQDYDNFLIKLQISIESCRSISQIGEVVNRFIEDFSNSSYLKQLLANKYSHMCLSGYLPRNFTVQVKPHVLMLAQEYYLDFLAKSDGLFSGPDEKHIAIFENLIRNLINSENEAIVKKELENSIEKTRAQIAHKKQPMLWFVEKSWNHLLTALLNIQQQLALAGCTRSNDTFLYDPTTLHEAIQIIEAQIELKQVDVQEQLRRMHYYYTKAFEKVKSCPYDSAEIIACVKKLERLLVGLQCSVKTVEESSLGKLQRDYMAVWDDITAEVINAWQMARQQDQVKWRVLFYNVLQGRNYLQSLPESKAGHYLNVNFSYDKKILIEEKLCESLNTYYRKRVARIGKKRLQQIEELKYKLSLAKSAIEAATIAHSILNAIINDHVDSSLSYNLVVLRKPSRAAVAIARFIEQCEQQNLLPKIHSAQPSQVEKEFSRAIERYFATDLWMSSLSRRSISRKLMTAIQVIHAEVEQNKIMLIEGKQKISQVIDCAITESEKLHDQGEGLTRVLRFMGYKGRSRFTDCLKEAKQNLLEKKLLETNYQLVTWPKLKAIVENSILEYQHETITLQSEKDKGVEESYELLIQLQEATNAEHAAYILHVGICSLETGFPELSKKLSACFQYMRTEGILPAVSHTGFAKHIRDKVKQQAKEVSELRARLFKIK